MGRIRHLLQRRNGSSEGASTLRCCRVGKRSTDQQRRYPVYFGFAWRDWSKEVLFCRFVEVWTGVPKVQIPLRCELIGDDMLKIVLCALVLVAEVAAGAIN